MITIAMLDDEINSLEMERASLQVAFNSHNEKVDIHIFTEPEPFLKSFKDIKYDLVTLDVIMPIMDGNEVARRIREFNEDIPIIFISSNEEKVFSCFKYDPIGFIRKTNFFADSATMVNHYLQDIMPKMKKGTNIEIRSHGETMVVNLRKIMYIEGEQNYQNIYLSDSDKAIQVRYSMNSLVEQLSSFGFVRVHKGFLVNYAYIQKFGSSYLVLTNGKQIPLSRGNKVEILERYMDLTSSMNV